MASALKGGAASNVSVFAGRIADTGRDPVPLMAEAVEMLRAEPNAELIWASPRELLNIFQADAIGCHIITVTHDILKKLSLVGKDLERLLARYGEDVLRRCASRRIHAGARGTTLNIAYPLANVLDLAQVSLE